jgi:hypothetical protein
MISLQVRYAIFEWHAGAIEFLGTTASDEVDGSHPTASQWQLLATSRRSEGCAGASALPLKADIRNARTLRTQKADIGCLLCP